MRELEKKRNFYFKDLSFIKAEIDWLKHKIENLESRGQSLSTDDLRDLTDIVNRAFKKF